MSQPSPNPVICALDTVELPQARALAQQVKDHVGALKLGLEFFTANGPQGVRAVAELGLPIFLDLKFHDIPNTVAGAIRAVAGLPVFMMTVHTTGGRAMMEAAVAEAKKMASCPMVVGVTVLTSMNQQDLNQIGVSSEVADQVQNMALLARESGLDGVVCSPHEIALVRRACGPDFMIVTPGVRPVGSDAGDQKRVMTPAEALAAGADFLVIGRPITSAPDPTEAAKEIFQGLR